MCPPGFVQDLAAKTTGLPPCKPDPADCGSDPFGGVAEGNGNLFVDAKAAVGGDGSRSKPFTKIADAKAVAGTGVTIALAAGKYFNNAAFHNQQTLQGRCAAMVTVSGNGLFALGTYGKQPQTQIVVRGITVINQGMAPIDLGAAAMVQGGEPALRLERVHISGTRIAAIDVHGSGARLTMVDCVIDNMQTGQFSGKDGLGISVNSGGRLELQRVRISGARRIALLARGDGTEVVARDLLIDNTLVDPKSGLFGRAIGVQTGAKMWLHQAVIQRNRDIAVFVSGAGSRLHGAGVLIADVQSLATKPSFGRALEVNGGAQVQLAGAQIRLHSELAFLVGGEQSTLHAVGLLVDGAPATTDAGLQRGGGGVAQHAAQLTLHNCQLRTLQGRALDIHDTGTVAALNELAIAHVRDVDSETREGIGLAVLSGAVVTMRRAHLADTQSFAVLVAKTGSVLDASDVLVSAVQATTAGTLGRGFDIQEGAQARLMAVRATGSPDCGLFVSDAGSRVRAAGVLVDQAPTPPVGGAQGRGVTIQLGANGTLAGATIAQVFDAAVFVRAQNAKAILAGVAVSNVAPVGEPLQWGTGIYAAETAQVTATGLQVVGAHTAAALVQDALFELTDAALGYTKAGNLRKSAAGTVTFADGVLATGIHTLSLTRVVISHCGRAGLLAEGPLAASVSASVVRDNVLGVVRQKGATVALTHSAVVDNSQQNNAGDAGLAVPPAPALAKLDVVGSTAAKSGAAAEGPK